MQDRDVLRYERASRVKTFLNNNSGEFAAGSKYHTIHTRMDTIVFQLDADRVGQIRTPLTKDEVIDALHDDFKDIARTARAIHQEKPEFPAEDYRHPGSYTENATANHADHLLSLLEDNPGDTTEQLDAKIVRRAEFTGYEMDPAFVSDLRATRNSLDSANAGKHSDNQEGLESTASINTLLNEANGLVTRLHGLIQNKFKTDPDKIHAWKQASRIERSPQPPTPPVEPVPPTP